MVMRIKVNTGRIKYRASNHTQRADKLNIDLAKDN